MLADFVAGFFPRLSQAGVDEGAHEGAVALLLRGAGGEPFAHDLRPGQPAQGGIQAGQVVAAHTGVGVAGLPVGGAAEFAAQQHGGLVVFFDDAAVVPAHVVRAVGLWRAVGGLVPLDAVGGGGAPLQCLVFAAVRAGDQVAALVALEVGGLDAREVADGGGAGLEALAAREGGLARLGQGDGVALAVHVERVTVGFVEDDVAYGHGAQAGGTVGAGHGEESAGVFLEQGGVGVVAAAVELHLALERGGFFDHGRQALAAVALGHVERGLHDHERAGLGVDQVADPVVGNGGLAGLGAPHEHDFFDGVGGAECVLRLEGVGGAGDAVGAWLGAVLGGHDAVAFGPFGDGEDGRGR